MDAFSSAVAFLIAVAVAAVLLKTQRSPTHSFTARSSIVPFKPLKKTARVPDRFADILVRSEIDGHEEHRSKPGFKPRGSEIFGLKTLDRESHAESLLNSEKHLGGLDNEIHINYNNQSRINFNSGSRIDFNNQNYIYSHHKNNHMHSDIANEGIDKSPLYFQKEEATRSINVEKDDSNGLQNSKPSKFGSTTNISIPHKDFTDKLVGNNYQDQSVEGYTDMGEKVHYEKDNESSRKHSLSREFDGKQIQNVTNSQKQRKRVILDDDVYLLSNPNSSTPLGSKNCNARIKKKLRQSTPVTIAPISNSKRKADEDIIPADMLPENGWITPASYRIGKRHKLDESGLSFTPSPSVLVKDYAGKVSRRVKMTPMKQDAKHFSRYPRSVLRKPMDEDMVDELAAKRLKEAIEKGLEVTDTSQIEFAPPIVVQDQKGLTESLDGAKKGYNLSEKHDNFSFTVPPSNTESVVRGEKKPDISVFNFNPKIFTKTESDNQKAGLPATSLSSERDISASSIVPAFSFTIPPSIESGSSREVPSKDVSTLGTINPASSVSVDAISSNNGSTSQQIAGRYSFGFNVLATPSDPAPTKKSTESGFSFTAPIQSNPPALLFGPTPSTLAVKTPNAVTELDPTTGSIFGAGTQNVNTPQKIPFGFAPTNVSGSAISVAPDVALSQPGLKATPSLNTSESLDYNPTNQEGNTSFGMGSSLLNASVKKDGAQGTTLLFGGALPSSSNTANLNKGVSDSVIAHSVNDSAKSTMFQNSVATSGSSADIFGTSDVQAVTAFNGTIKPTGVSEIPFAFGQIASQPQHPLQGFQQQANLFVKSDDKVLAVPASASLVGIPTGTFGTQPGPGGQFNTPILPSAQFDTQHAADKSQFGNPLEPNFQFGAQPVATGAFGKQPVATGAFGTQPGLGSQFGTPIVPNFQFGTHPTAPTSQFGNPAVPTVPFGAHPVVSSQFGAPTGPISQFGTHSVPNSQFGAPPVPNLQFGSQATVKSAQATGQFSFGSEQQSSGQQQFGQKPDGAMTAQQQGFPFGGNQQGLTVGGQAQFGGNQQDGGQQGAFGGNQSIGNQQGVFGGNSQIEFGGKQPASGNAFGGSQIQGAFGGSQPSNIQGAFGGSQSASLQGAFGGNQLGGTFGNQQGGTGVPQQAGGFGVSQTQPTGFGGITQGQQPASSFSFEAAATPSSSGFTFNAGGPPPFNAAAPNGAPVFNAMPVIPSGRKVTQPKGRFRRK